MWKEGAPGAESGIDRGVWVGGRRRGFRGLPKGLFLVTVSLRTFRLLCQSPERIDELRWPTFHAHTQSLVPSQPRPSSRQQTLLSVLSWQSWARIRGVREGACARILVPGSGLDMGGMKAKSGVFPGYLRCRAVASNPRLPKSAS